MGLLDLASKLKKGVSNALGTSNESVVRSYMPLVQQVNALETQMQAADDAQLRELSSELRQRLQGGTPVAEITPEAFALVREVADRRLGAWNAISAGINPAIKVRDEFPEEAWGDQLAAVRAARKRIADGETMREIDLPAAVYAKVREYRPDSVPPFRLRAHDVQVIGGAVLHDGKIAELRTGEGKTLVAVFACYLNAMIKPGIHVVTTNDFLAKRDATWNAPVLNFLGLEVGSIEANMDPRARKQAYTCDVVYGQNSEFGFDYLRDNLKQSLEDQVCRERPFAIVDEVDSILIDEARTPLIISGPAEGREVLYPQADSVAQQLEEGRDFEIDLKDRTVTLTEEGVERATGLFGVGSMYDAEGMHIPHFLDNALRAHYIFQKDIDYLVAGGEVKIIDEFTGRALEGRRWSDGLHQAVEAKEGVAIQPESQTYATITYQNYFRMYEKLAGMTGTALTEAGEFDAIYKLHAIAVPTNRPVIRRDMHDLIYGSEEEKFDAIVEEVEELHAVGQPILIGTASVEASERLSEAFKRRGIRHNVLNARQHSKEGEIVAQAGQLGAVTVSTNMAGRGVDIVLGRGSGMQLLKHWKGRGLCPKRLKVDSPELDEACLDLWAKRYLGDEMAEKLRGSPPQAILDEINKRRRLHGWDPLPLPSVLLQDGYDIRQLGGLRVIGTERHESRRVDNQLRGRSGRQGDPGSSRFYLSLEDQLMKRFISDTMKGMMVGLGLKQGEAIESRMVSRAVEKSQKRVEEYNFGIRKNVVEYDEVMNIQRREIYRTRQRILRGEGLESLLLDFFADGLDDLVQECAADGTRGSELAARLTQAFAEETGLPKPAPDSLPVQEGGDACRDKLMELVRNVYAGRKTEIGPEGLEHVLRFVLLDGIDRRWKDHIDFMDTLRRGIGFEGMGQRDPKLRYKEEGYRHFQMMYQLIRKDVASVFFRLQVSLESAPPPAATRRPARSAPPVALGSGAPVPAGGQPGPDDPCPCGSGMRFRDCHGII